MQRPSRRFLPVVRTSLLATAVLAFACASGALAQPTITNLGALPTASGATIATGISGDGTTVVGYGLVGFQSQSRAFRWTAASGMVEVGLLPTGSLAVANAIAASAPMIVGRADEFQTQPFAVISGGSGFAKLGGTGGLPGGGTASASAASASGTVVVGTGSLPGGSRAFRSLSNGPLENLGVPPGAEASSAAGVSGDGQVIVGSCQLIAGGQRAFRWTQALGMVDLAAQPLSGTFPSASATCTNADGSVIAGSATSSTVIDRFFRWTSTGGTTFLPSFAGSTGPTPRAMTPDGQIIVGDTDQNRAMIWTSCLGTADLNTYLSSLGVNLTGWILTNATGISADGSAICGTGTINGQSRPWIVRGLTSGAGAAPQVLTQPQTAFGCFDFGGSFSITTAGLGTPQVQWQYKLGPTGAWTNLSNGTLSYNALPIASFNGVQSTTLTFTSARVTETELRVRAIVSNGCGSATSNEATLIVFNASCCVPGQQARITQQPGSGAVCVGGSFAASVVNSGDLVTSVWQISGGPFLGWTTLSNGPLVVAGITRAQVSGATGQSLVLTNVQFDPSDLLIRNIAVNDCSIDISSEITMSVTSDAIAEQPGSTAGCYPFNGQFFVTASSTTPQIRWQIAFGDSGPFTDLENGLLTHQGLPVATFSGATTPTLSFTGASYVIDIETVRVRAVVTGCGAAPTPSDIVTLDVFNGSCCGPDQRAFVDVAPEPASVTQGDTVVFTAAGNAPSTTNRWQLRSSATGSWTTVTDGSVVIDGQPVATASGAATQTLTLSNVTLSPGVAQVRYIASNGCSIDLSAPADLTVSGGASIGCSPSDIAYGDGEPLPPIGLPGGFNPVGPDGGDFDCFFNFYFTPEPDNAVCDIAYGDGEPLPPYGVSGGFNPGVDGGDFDCFFNFYFNGCL